MLMQHITGDEMYIYITCSANDQSFSYLPNLGGYLSAFTSFDSVVGTVNQRLKLETLMLNLSSFGIRRGFTTMIFQPVFLSLLTKILESDESCLQKAASSSNLSRRNTFPLLSKIAQIFRTATSMEKKMTSQSSSLLPDPRLKNKIAHYDRDEIVADILSFYNFLPHVSASNIARAPPDGPKSQLQALQSTASTKHPKPLNSCVTYHTSPTNSPGS